jgi:hypothetical protein
MAVAVPEGMLRTYGMFEDTLSNCVCSPHITLRAVNDLLSIYDNRQSRLLE